jgi:dTDP-glucose 4,6-dehydratase
MNILVIGSNSFSGSHFVNYLLNKNYNVLGIGRTIYPKLFLPYTNNKNIRKFKFFKLDLNKNFHYLKKIIIKHKPKYVVNFASQGMVAESWTTPEDWFNTNTLTVTKLINFLKDQSFLKKYVHISTPEVYGSTKKNFKESDIYKPTTPYAISRAATDMTLNAFYKAYKFPYISTRAANVYGTHQQLYRIIPITILNILNKKKIKLHGGGKSQRSFIHIRDVVEGTYLLMKKSNLGQIYHLSANNFLSIESLVKKICKQMNTSFNDCVIHTKERLGKDLIYDLNSSKINRKFKWKPKVDIDQGIDEVISWIKENLNQLNKYPNYYIHKK